MSGKWSIKKQIFHYCGCCRHFHEGEEGTQIDINPKLKMYEGNVYSEEDIETLREKLIEDVEKLILLSDSTDGKNFGLMMIRRINHRFGVKK